MPIGFDKLGGAFVAIDADAIAPELRAAQPTLPLPTPTGARIVCPAGLRIVAADRQRIKDEIALDDATIDGYLTGFVAVRVAQGNAGQRGDAQRDELTPSEWQRQAAASVVKQAMLAGYVAGDTVICPQADDRALASVPPRHRICEGVAVREADAAEKAAIDADPTQVQRARDRKLAELAKRSLRAQAADAELVARRLAGETGQALDDAVARLQAEADRRAQREAAIAAATTVGEVEAVDAEITAAQPVQLKAAARGG